MLLYMVPTARFDIATVVMEDIVVPIWRKERTWRVAQLVLSFASEREASILKSKQAVFTKFIAI
jgi:hypothetical protein